MISTVPPLVGPDLSEGKTAVYFLKVVGQPIVKIGSARKWRNRTGILQCGNHLPLEVILLAKGGGQAERACQKALSGHGIRGEWFSLNAVVEDLIARIIAADGNATEAADELWAERLAGIRARIARFESVTDTIIATVLPLASAGRAS